MLSPMEKKIVKIIGKKEISIKDITKQYYGKEKKPIGANNNIAAAIRRIILKCSYYNVDWIIDGKGTGRRGRIVWIEKRVKKRSR